MPIPFRALLGPGRHRRRVRVSGHHLHLELHRVDGEARGEFARRVRSALSTHPGVQAVHVFGALDQAVVTFTGEATDADDLADDLVDALDTLDASFDVADRPFGRDHPGHPDDEDVVARRTAAFGAAVVGLAVAAGRQMALLPPPPFGGRIAAALAFAEHHPRIRALVERGIGREPAEVLLAVADGITQGLTGSPIGPGVAVMHRRQRLLEARARRQLWHDHKADYTRVPASDTVPGEDGAARTPRPRAVRSGTIERYSDAALVAGLGGAGATFAWTGSLPLTTGIVTLGVPRAADHGREGFATRLSTILAADDVLVLDPRVLRLLDRVDTLVVDADLLLARGAPPTPFPGARELLAEAREAGLDFVVMGRTRGVQALGEVDGSVERRGLVGAVRRLQAEGRVVAMVGSAGSPGLAVADVAMGLRDTGTPLPWDADLVVTDGGVRHARMLVAMCAAGRQVSRDSVVLASAGVVAGIAAVFLGLPWNASRRAADSINLAAGASLANGIRIAAGVPHTTAQPVPDDTPVTVSVRAVAAGG